MRLVPFEAFLMFSMRTRLVPLSTQQIRASARGHGRDVTAVHGCVFHLFPGRIHVARAGGGIVDDYSRSVCIVGLSRESWLTGYDRRREAETELEWGGVQFLGLE